MYVQEKQLGFIRVVEVNLEALKLAWEDFMSSSHVLFSGEQIYSGL